MPDGAEILLLEGSLTESGDILRKGAWLRLPVGASLNAKAGPEGARLWVKLRHIPHAKPPAT